MKKIKKSHIIIGIILLVVCIFAIIIQTNPDVSYFFLKLVNPDFDKRVITFEKADYYGFATVNGDIVAAYRDNIKIYDTDLKEKETIAVSGVDPTVKTNGKNMIVFYPSENKALVKIGSETKNISTPYYILNATVNKNGYYALITEEKGFKSQVIVCDNKGSEIYKWHSSDYYITDVSISDDNKHMVLTSLAPDKDAIKSSIMVFSFTDEKPIAQIVKTDVTYISASFINKNKIAIIGDKKAGVFNLNLSPVWEEDYSTKQLFTYSADDKNIILALGNTKSASEKVSVKIYSPSGNLKGEFIHNGEITGIDTSQNSILVYGKRNLYNISESGKVKRQLDLNIDILHAFTVKNGVFVVSNSVGKIYYLRW